MIRFYNFMDFEEICSISRAYEHLSGIYRSRPAIEVICLASLKELEDKLRRRVSRIEVGFSVKNMVYLLAKEVILKSTVWKQKHLAQLYMHELVHAFNSALNPERCPLWLEEGIASYFSKMHDKCFVNLATSNGKLIDFENLAERQGWDAYQGILRYYQAGSFVGNLADSYSIQKVLELKRCSSKDLKRFNKSFLEIFGVSLAIAIERWKREVLKAKAPLIRKKWLIEQVNKELNIKI